MIGPQSSVVRSDVLQYKKKEKKKENSVIIKIFIHKVHVFRKKTLVTLLISTLLTDRTKQGGLSGCGRFVCFESTKNRRIVVLWF